MIKLITNVRSIFPRKRRHVNKIDPIKNPTEYMASIGVLPTTIRQFQKISDEIKTKELELDSNTKENGGDTHAPIE